MRIGDLLKTVSGVKSWGDFDVEVAKIRYRSDQVEAGDVFFALPGVSVDGHSFVGDAIERGAVAVVAQRDPESDPGVTWFKVRDSRAAMAEAAAVFYDRPSTEMKGIGITGTNGKSSTAIILHYLLGCSWFRCGLLGTIEYDLGDEKVPATHTTPESVELAALLRRMRDADCRGVVMEVSSHALDQSRVGATAFAVGIYTNLSQDHLDYHRTMDEYFEAKMRLVDLVKRSGGKFVYNGDDPFGDRLRRRYGEKLPLISFGAGVRNDFRISDIQGSVKGTQFKLSARGREFLVRIPYIGRFNVYNATAALAGAVSAGANFREAVANIARAPQVPGRLERIDHPGSFHVFVDYAHTPDALEKVLQTLRDLKPWRLLVVFGCGGDRDKGKRPLMGAAAANGSDLAFLTSDNPRGEDPEAIIRDVRAGCQGRAEIVSIVDREKAIFKAIDAAEYNDIVLIAGKGHETTQQFADKTVSFDDRKVASRALRMRAEVEREERDHDERRR